MSIFAEMECHFSAVSIAVYTVLIHHLTCRLEARQALIYQLVSGLTGENGKYNYSRAVHLYPPFFDITCSAKNYKIAPALTTTSYQEQDRQKVAAYQEEIKDIPPEKIAYVDESGIDTYLYREYGYAPRGQQVYGQVRGRKYQRCGIVAALMGDRILAPFQYNGTMDSRLFEFWFSN